MTKHLLAVVSALLLSACVTPIAGTPMAMGPGPAAERVGEFKSTGEVFSSAAAGKSAAFDAWRIVGPKIDLVRDGKGGWIGSAGARDRGFELKAEDGELRGAGVNVSILKQPDGTIYIGGLFFQTRYEVFYGPKRLKGQTHNSRCGFDLDLVGPGSYDGEVACGGQIGKLFIRFAGDAAKFDDITMPQTVLALLAVLP